MLSLPQPVQHPGQLEGYPQLLNLALKLTGANQGAFLSLDPRGSLQNPGKQQLPQDYWKAARQAARSLAPLLFQGQEDQASSPPLLAVPVHRGGDLLGVLVIADRPHRFLDYDDLNLVKLLSDNPFWVAPSPAERERFSVHRMDSIRALLKTLKARDHYTCEHSFRVTNTALQFGRFLGLAEEELSVIKTAGPLHDLGKVGISDAILLKEGALTQEECSIMKTHPVIGGKIVKPLGLNQAELEIIIHHHERWDGRGYPWGLYQREIPFLCRLVALADVFDALTSDRPYRRLFPVTVALEEMAAHSGTHFDPELTQEFIKMMSSQG